MTKQNNKTIIPFLITQWMPKPFIQLLLLTFMEPFDEEIHFFRKSNSIRFRIFFILTLHGSKLN